jgi:hypothetical protein
VSGAGAVGAPTGGPAAPPVAAELWRALAAVVTAPPGPALASALGLADLDAEAHTAAFVLDAVPYAGWVLDPDGVIGGEATRRVADFYRAVGLGPTAEPDHLGRLLSLLAGLRGRGRRSRLVRGTLVLEHLVSWLPPYLDVVGEVAPALRIWAELVRDGLLVEVVELGGPEAGRLPAALREAPPEPALRSLDDLLVPVRAGVVLTSTRLFWIAQVLGVSARLGDRRRILRSLLATGEPAVRRALADLASDEAVRRRTDAGRWGPAGAWWADRAAATAAALRDGRVAPSHPAPPSGGPTFGTESAEGARSGYDGGVGEGSRDRLGARPIKVGPDGRSARRRAGLTKRDLRELGPDRDRGERLRSGVADTEGRTTWKW